jgi:hypothetical protein
VRFELGLPGKLRIAEVSGAAVLARGRHLHPVGQFLEPVLVEADHEAHDLVGALLVEAVLIVKQQHVALLAVAAVHQEPAPRRLDEHTIGKISPYLEQGEGCKTIGRILLPSQHRQSQFLYDGMT